GRIYFKGGSLPAHDEAMRLRAEFFLSADAVRSPGENSDAQRIARLKRLAASLSPDEAEFISKHWLIGVWAGEIRGANWPDGPKRTMTIGAVRRDGSVIGGWAVSADGAVGRAATMQVAGERISIVTLHKATAILQRSGADRLYGSFTTATGEVYRITL